MGWDNPMSVRHVDRNLCNTPLGKRLDGYTAGRRHKVDKNLQSCRKKENELKKNWILISDTCIFGRHTTTLTIVIPDFFPLQNLRSGSSDTWWCKSVGVWVLTGWATAAEPVRLAQGRLEEESCSGWSQLLACQLQHVTVETVLSVELGSLWIQLEQAPRFLELC